MIAVIADDLSGATELGAMGLRHGLRAEIVLENAAGSDADLVCVDTDSRSCSVGEAGSRAKAAAKSLREAGARWIYKKTDSVLRGRVVAEIEALMEELGLKRAFLLSANPSLGRVVRDGKYFVHGKPVHETEFARDPEYPRTSANVIDMLGGPAKQRLRVCSTKDALPESGIIVGAAETSGDLRAWLERLDAQTLAAGAAEFFETIVASKYRGRGSLRIETKSHGAELFVCGSTSESSRAFIGSESSAGTPIFSLPAQLAQSGDFTEAQAESVARETVLALRQIGRVILNIGLPLISNPDLARKLSRYLARLARGVIESGEVGHVYAEGGATAIALMREMGWRCLIVVRELAQGVATVKIQNNDSLYLTVKPGTYVWPDSVRRTKI